MSGDYSRDSFDSLRDFAGVFLQQGRAVLDADWNEMVQIFERRIRAGTVDTIGRAVVPRETADGFAIRIASGSGLEIGPGRLYLDGMLVQNAGQADFDGTAPDLPAAVFDRGSAGTVTPAGVLDEMIAPPGGDWLSYDRQPYWPAPAALPGPGGTHLAYLVAWQREVTPVKDPTLLEPALGGIDTTTRWQTVWQVRVLADVGANATCATPDADLQGWTQTIAPSTARLTTDTIEIEDPENPCLVPPTDGYSGIENQLYRVELHATEPGAPPTRFKFSRENASVAATIEAIASPAASVTVTRIGRDEVLRFSAGDWVEITDNRREFDHRSGQMLRVASVNPETREIAFETGTVVDPDLIPSGAAGDSFADRRTRLIRWDQRGIVRRANGTPWEDLDAAASDGLIPIPPAGTTLILESGITVRFSTAEGPGAFRDMDYWRFAARTAGTSVEKLRAAPPEGIQRHHCRLGVVRFPNSVQDCRVFWPPDLPEGGETKSCGCTVCVTAEGHNSGALTIQAAIDQVGAAGGTVCLEAGAYALSEPVVISEQIGLRLTGQGVGTILAYRGRGGAIRVDRSHDIRLDGFSLFAAPGEDEQGNAVIVHGIAATDCTGLALRRLAVVLLSRNPEDSFDFGIALDRLQMAAQVEDCLVIAPHALGARASYGLDEDDDLTFVALAELRVEDCILFGGRVGVLFDRVALNIAQAVFARTMVLGMGRGALIRLAETPAAATRIEGCSVLAQRSALVLGSGDLTLRDCQISGGDEGGDGIVLADGLLPEQRTDAQITGNAIFDLAGAGLRIEGLHGAVLVKRNVIRRCGAAGILVEPDADIRHIAIDNNVIEDIARQAGEANTVGIAVAAAQGGQIAGNALRGIGQGARDGQLCAGIAAQNLGGFAIRGNSLAEIGPGRGETRAIAILLRPPYDGLLIEGNMIEGDLGADPEALTGWLGIQIGTEPQEDARGGVGKPVQGHMASLPQGDARALAYVETDGMRVHLSRRRYRVTPSRALLNQIGLTGNQLRHGAGLLAAAVQVFDAGAVSLAFAQNQCLLEGRRHRAVAVLLGAQRLMVSGNAVTHAGDTDSLQLRGRAATVIGNVTSAGIRLNGAALPAPFDALNIIA